MQKFLARAGVASRRRCESLIAEGRVTVNGSTASELGVRVVPGEDQVRVDGVPVKAESLLYLLMNKPKNCLCTSRDDQGRRTVHDFLPGIAQRVYTVGRLDYDAEGLLILTNDGDFAQRVIHPRFSIPRTYRVRVKGSFSPEGADRMRRGVKLDGRVVQPVRLLVQSRGEKSSRIRIEVVQGMNRQVKRMFKAVGYEVTGIKRTKLGHIGLGSLAPGEFRRMTRSEVESFSRAQDRKPQLSSYQEK